MKLHRGYLFAIEGIDGSGKTSVMNLIAQKLEQLNYPIFTTREPGATQLGKDLRALLMNKTAPTCTLAEFLLFAADRAQHFHEFIMPHLEQHHIVISDRMADSALVYQGYVKGLDQLMIESVNKWAMQYRIPDMVIYLKVSAQTAIDRINQRNEVSVPFEQEILQKKQQIIDGFDAIFNNRKNVAILDATITSSQQTNTIAINPSWSAEEIANIIIEKIILPYLSTTEECFKQDE